MNHLYHVKTCLWHPKFDYQSPSLKCFISGFGSFPLFLFLFYFIFFLVFFVVLARHLYRLRYFHLSNTVERENREAWKLENERKYDGWEEKGKEWAFAAAKFHLDWWTWSREEDTGSHCWYNSPLSPLRPKFRNCFGICSWCWRAWMFSWIKTLHKL